MNKAILIPAVVGAVLVAATVFAGPRGAQSDADANSAPNRAVAYQIAVQN